MQPESLIGMLSPRAYLLFGDNTTVFVKKQPKGLIVRELDIDTVVGAIGIAQTDSHWLQQSNQIATLQRYGINRGNPWFIASLKPKIVSIELNSTSVEIPLPPSLIFAYNQQIHLWAVKSNKFSTQLKLFHHPLPNVDLSGRVCWGNLQPPESEYHHLGKIWSLFIASSFNYDYSDGKSLAEPDSSVPFLLGLAGHREYPLEDLVATELVAENILELYL